MPNAQPQAPNPTDYRERIPAAPNPEITVSLGVPEVPSPTHYRVPKLQDHLEPYWSAQPQKLP